METRAQKIFSRVSPRAVVICHPSPRMPAPSATVWPRCSEDDDTFFKLPLEPRKPCKSFCVGATQQRPRHAGGHPIPVLSSAQQGDQNGRTNRRWSLDRSSFFAVPHSLRIHDSAQIKMKTFIASGGFGSVYKGQFRGRTVAFKKMHRCVKNVKAKVESFKAECSAQYLKHANVVQILATSIGDPTTKEAWIVMEYAGDKNLQNVVSNPQELLNFRRRLRYAVDIISALRYIHERHVIHLDLKPANVIITPQDNCKLGDFGCCQTVIDDGHSCGLPSPLLRTFLTGTCAYRAPELLRGRAPTSKADIYSFGIVLWQMMSRETPYSGQNQHVIVYRVVEFGIRPRAMSPGRVQHPMQHMLRRDEVSSDSSAGSNSSGAGMDSRHSSSSSTSSDSTRIITNASPATMEEFYRSLYVMCWDADPDNRPTADDTADLLQSWSEYFT